MNYTPINTEDKLKLFNDYWSPKVIAQLNDYQVKLVKIKGDFTWHSHSETDELFFVLEGEMKIDFEDGIVTLRKGEMFIVPKNALHKPFAEYECKVMVIEPTGVVNTGDIQSKLTAENDVWI